LEKIALYKYQGYWKSKKTPKTDHQNGKKVTCNRDVSVECKDNIGHSNREYYKNECEQKKSCHVQPWHIPFWINLEKLHQQLIVFTVN